jgi:hypothetical protein
VGKFMRKIEIPCKWYSTCSTGRHGLTAGDGRGALYPKVRESWQGMVDQTYPVSPKPTSRALDNVAASFVGVVKTSGSRDSYLNVNSPCSRMMRLTTMAFHGRPYSGREPVRTEASGARKRDDLSTESE